MKAKQEEIIRAKVTNWDAVPVTFKKNSDDHKSVRRKVITRGVTKIYVNMTAIHDAIRQGYEVRLVGNGFGDAIRLFPCLSHDYDRLFVAAQTMGDFRECIADKNVQFFRGGKRTTANEYVELKAEQTKIYEQEKAEQVTPDTLITCPRCGNRFRVGRKIGA